MTTAPRRVAPPVADTSTGLLPVRTTEDGATAARRRRRGWRWWLLEALAIAVGVLVLLALTRALVLERFRVESGGMGERLPEGASVLVLKQGEPERGEVVVFRDPGGWAEAKPAPGPLRRLAETLGLAPTTYPRPLVMRVVGLPGDEVRCCDELGRLLVNGVAIDEPYTTGSVPGGRWRVVVPTHSYFVLGDERDRARDSRCHLDETAGISPFVDEHAIVGAARINLTRAKLGAQGAFDRVPGRTPAPARGIIELQGGAPC